MCPGRPVLPTPNEDVNPAKCIRCQGDDRWLPVPHPGDHLCGVCRRECPQCQALTPQGGLCLTCQGKCRTCRGPLPERSAEVRVVKPEDRKDRKRRWSRHYFPHTAGRDRCDACLSQGRSHDPVRAVLAAVPDPLVRACRGGLPSAAVTVIHEQLQYRTPRQLRERMERRWWGSWASRPLNRKSDEKQEGYRAEDVIVWLLAASPCPGGCEDGFHPDNPDRLCSVCQGSTRPPTPTTTTISARTHPAPAHAADRSTAEAVAYRPPMTECTGKAGSCGVPVAAPYTQCPECLNWPRCVCGSRRFDPAQSTACRTCAGEEGTS
ncbi:hypothetical protein IPZ58_28120 [Streptomyces roseoverticillatus]|nr:hypothetical protein [Streptomyces roseoverticillatus]